MTEHNKQGCGGIRRRSAKTLFGLPLFDVAVGPDLERGELRGHACGIIAYGGISIGILSFGGLSFGLLALGGLAAGGIACGGCAAGFVAVGGAAAGYYAAGGQVVGKYAVSALGSSPAAVKFFSKWLPFLPVNR